MATTNDPIIGKKLGNYNIVEILGKGGMARVYRGYDAKLNRYAAVKVFEAHLIPEQDQDEYRKRFENEARAIAHLRHPNIVGVYQFDQVGTIYYMAMEFIDGRDLRHVLRNHAKNNTRMAYSEILQVIKDIGGGLDYSHREGVIHRDIKPSNIMVTSSGKSVLTDFGLALSIPEGTMGNTFGSAHYIAPEQAVSSAQAVPQSDLYSLGIVLFEMLTNRVPFNDPSAMVVAMKHLNDTPPAPSRYNPNLSPAIDQVVLRALSKDVGKRFSSGIAMAQALETAFGGLDEADTNPANEAGLLASWDAPAVGTSPSRQTASTIEQRGGATRPMPPKTPVFNTSSSILATDSRLSRPTKTTQPEPPTESPADTRQSNLLIALAVLGLIAIVVAGALLLTNANQPATPTPSASTVPLVGGGSTAAVTEEPATDTAVPTRVPTRVAVVAAITEEATPEMTAAATLEASATPTIRPTRTPTRTPRPTTAPTATEIPPTAVLTAEATALPTLDTAAPVRLHYDDQSLALINQSDKPVDVSELTFVQTEADGGQLTFESRRWEGGSRPTYALPAGDCFQVFRDDAATTGKPTDCRTRHSWERTSFIHWFWISTDPDATFVVQREDTVLGTCSIAAGECALRLEP